MSTLNVLPIDPTPCPYYKGQHFVMKADVVYQATLLTLDEEERIESLVNAFYLGALLQEAQKWESCEGLGR
ncbi:27923_t:CDS:2 [Dentiscutata erythropus]|uniref:27923_t:CDS:1 n=1 Tax=Dentiscutata erythropus TaxID=1348616 RepID=A0A9N9G7H9_9GLOM|nr:27923_t:CDS:2 [Dentiscutata erythropus]